MGYVSLLIARFTYRALLCCVSPRRATIVFFCHCARFSSRLITIWMRTFYLHHNTAVQLLAVLLYLPDQRPSSPCFVSDHFLCVSLSPCCPLSVYGGTKLAYVWCACHSPAYYSYCYLPGTTYLVAAWQQCRSFSVVNTELLYLSTMNR